MSKIKYDGTWLQIQAKDYVDKTGCSHEWEFVSRKDSNCSVTVVPIIRGVHSCDRIVLVKQFRPALDKYIFGLPSGRVLPSENAETAALRELKEETGYSGRLISPPIPFFALPESSSEITFLTMVEIQDYREPEKNQIEVIDLAIMDISELHMKLLQPKEFNFDLRVLSVFFYMTNLE